MFDVIFKQLNVERKLCNLVFLNTFYLNPSVQITHFPSYYVSTFIVDELIKITRILD